MVRINREGPALGCLLGCPLERASQSGQLCYGVGDGLAQLLGVILRPSGAPATTLLSLNLLMGVLAVTEDVVEPGVYAGYVAEDGG